MRAGGERKEQYMKNFNKLNNVKRNDNVMELDINELNNYQKQLKADRTKNNAKSNNKNRFQQLINNNRVFKTLFIEPKSFVMATEKSVMINLFGLKFFVPQNMAKLNEKSSKGSVYSSITINKEWTYKVWQSKEVSKGVYENFNEQEVLGTDIIDWFYKNLE